MSIFSMKKRKFYTAVSLCTAVLTLCLIPAAFGAGTIDTVAGTGSGGYDLTHEGVPATEATLNLPVDVFVDDTGFYIADSSNNRIRRVNLSDGIIYTVAGSNSTAYNEILHEGKAATSAGLGNPLNGVASSGGTFYIADAYSSNRRVFKVEGGNIFTIDKDVTPSDVIVYDGFLYVSYTSDPVVKKINISTEESSVFAGTGEWAILSDGVTTAKLGSITALASDSDGNIYIAENSLNRIRKVAIDGSISLFAGGNGSGFSGDGDLATLAKLKSPKGIAVDVFGNVYIADTGNNRIRKVSGGIISTIAGDGTAAASNETNAAIGDGGEAILARLNNPRGLSVDSSGNLYIADSGTNRVRKITFTIPEKGDLNASGTVDLADAITGLKVLAGIGSADVRADVDGDQKISMGDVIAILKYVLDGTPL